MDNAILLAKQLIEANYTPDGYNVGMNCGETAGQTVFHFHCHVIPRYAGDMDDPRGGVRHFPSDFMFELTQQKYDSLRSQTVTLKKKGISKHLVNAR